MLKVILITLAEMNRWCKSLGFEEHSNMSKNRSFIKYQTFLEMNEFVKCFSVVIQKLVAWL